jgi:NAD-dependent SIR2 family protein deacetylase
LTQIFPKWTNLLPGMGAALAGVGAPVLVFLVWLYLSPWNLDVGYAPLQPVPYSHKLHAGLLHMDCRYCHQEVEVGPHAAVPTNQTCMNCHTEIKKESEALEPIRSSFETGKPVKWVKVHLLPDYVYFSHAAHLNAGVGCVSCHGRIDQMEIVRQAKPLSMAWCLECHRAPAEHVRPADVWPTDMTYLDRPLKERIANGEARIAAQKLRPPTHCSACHH